MFDEDEYDLKEEMQEITERLMVLVDHMTATSKQERDDVADYIVNLLVDEVR